MKKITAKWFDVKNKDIKKLLYDTEMIVTKSNHPRFVKGSRFDFGFLQIASKEGYIIEIKPKD